MGEAPGERGRVWRSGRQEKDKKAGFPNCSLPFLHNMHNQH